MDEKMLIEAMHQMMAEQSKQMADMMDAKLEPIKADITKINMTLEHDVKTVSYTHLDVYKRQVLARELSLEEIGEIRAKTPAGLELEAFVHGAMCMAYSGRCMLSAYMTGRDANHGDCAQPVSYTHLDVYKRQRQAVKSSAVTAAASTPPKAARPVHKSRTNPTADAAAATTPSSTQSRCTS